MAAALIFVGSCGGGGGGGTPASAPAGTETPAAEQPMEQGPEMSELNLKEAAPATLESHGEPLMFTMAQGEIPSLGASGGPSINTYYIPEKAFDGNSRSWWAGQQDAGAWTLYYGFTQTVPIESVYINFYGAAYVPAGVSLSTSADGLAWNLVEEKTAGESKPLFTLAQPANAKYIRISMTGNPGTGYPLIRDIDWTPATENLGAYATPGVNDDHYFSDNALDGNPNTWWVGKVGAASWDFYNHFEAPQYIGMFTAELFNINYRPQNMKLFLSNDGRTWTEVGELTAGGSPSIFVGQSSSYWALQMRGNPPSTFPLIKDITYAVPAGASSGDSINSYYKPENAFDNNPDTWWTGKQDQTEWNLFYGYSGPADIGQVSIIYYAATHAPQSTELFVSNDGQTWTSAGTFAAGAAPSIWVGQTTSYLRFKMTGAPAVGYPLIKDISINGSGGEPVAAVQDSAGRPLSSIPQGDSVYIGLTGLEPGVMYDIEVTYPDGTTDVLNLTADHNGEIPDGAVLMYDAGLEIDPVELGGGSPRMAGRAAALTAGESITVVVKKQSSGQTVSQFTLPYSGAGTEPLAYAAKANGYFRNSFVCSLNENIYVAFRQFPPGEKVRVYVAKERQAWNIGDFIPDVTGSVEEFTLPSSSSLSGQQYMVWNNSAGTCAPIGNYDLIVERGDLDGYVGPDDIVDGHKPVGFVVAGAPTNGDIVEQIASDNIKHYKQVYDVNETVYVYMNPKIRSRVYEQISSGKGMVQKYVTNHKNIWSAGDSILDASQGIEGDRVQWGCYNESLVAVWPRPLTPGCYDIVIDADRDGLYDPGVDFLDNIDDNGNPTCGFEVNIGGVACDPRCVDAGDCEDGNDDTVDSCDLATTCDAYCRNDLVYCDLQVNKVNYVPGEPIVITFTARNETAQEVKCGAETALKRDKQNPNWNSFNEGMFIVIPPGTQVTRFMTKIIPGEWAGTDTSVGSDYDIYTVRENGTKWSKGDNFNIHVKWDCAVACFDNTDCASGEYCHNANTCSSACSTTTCTPLCTNDSQCDDGNADTADTCDNMGTCGAVCSHTMLCSNIACAQDMDCDDANTLTVDSCSQPATCSSACVNSNCTSACFSDSNCNDNNPLTRDTCTNPSTCSAACSYTPCTPACASDAQCDDGNAATQHACFEPNTCNASCTLINGTWTPLANSIHTVCENCYMDDIRPALALDASGIPYAVWNQAPGGSSGNTLFEIFLKYWDGAAWQALGASATGGGISNQGVRAVSPNIAFDNNGVLTVAWVSQDSSASLCCGVHLRRWNGSQWVPFVSSIASGSYPNSLHLAFDASNNPIVLLGGTRLYLMRHNGANWEGIGGSDAYPGISSGVNGSPYEAKVVIGQDGNPIVAWKSVNYLEYVYYTNRTNIYVRRWDGSAWQDIGPSTGYGITNYPASYPKALSVDLVLDSTGAPVVVWDVLKSGETRSIYVKRWNGANWTDMGAGSSTGNGISTATPYAYHSHATVDRNGRPMVSWTGTATVNTTVNDDTLYAARWNGASWEDVGAGSITTGIPLAGDGVRHSFIQSTSDGRVVGIYVDATGIIGAYSQLKALRWIP